MKDKINEVEWLLLIHQIPPKPDYLRVKIWRRLQKIGAVAIKQSVYVLPDNKQSYEDLHWLVREITAGGGTASLSRASFLEGLHTPQIKSLFQTARNTEYNKIVQDVNSIIKDLAQSSDHSDSSTLKKRKKLYRIQNRFNESMAIDFFNAPGRKVADKILTECETLLRKTKDNSSPVTRKTKIISGRTWVTRKEIFVDRIACAWLIHRFIDPEGKFKFVTEDGYQADPDELCFDMFEGAYTHQGDNCSFEVLVSSFELASQPITAIAEIVHDIDLKDKKFSRPEVTGIQAVFSGMATTCRTDQDRLKFGSMIFDELYASFEGVATKLT